jgi:hypothetical protein
MLSLRTTSEIGDRDERGDPVGYRDLAMLARTELLGNDCRRAIFVRPI